MPREAKRLILWCGVGVAAVVLGQLLVATGLPMVAVVPIGLAAVAFVVFSDDRMRAAVQASLILLVICRSVLATPLVSSTVPLWVAGLIALAIALGRGVSLPRRGILLVSIVGLSLVLPSVLQSGLTDAAKAAGIGAMWILVFIAGSALDEQARRAVIRCFIALAAVEAVIAILEVGLDLGFVQQYISADAITRTYVAQGTTLFGDVANRAMGTLGHPIPLGTILVVAMLLVALSDSTKRIGVKVALLALLGTGMALTGSRSAVVALAVGLAAYVIARLIRRRSDGAPLTAGLWVAAGVSVALAAGGVAFLVRAIAVGDFSLLHRSASIDAGASLGSLPVLRLIFGSGYGSIPRLYEEGYLHTDGAQVIDNTLVSQLAITGLVGTLALCAFVITAAVRSRPPGAAVICAIAAYFFFFDVPGWHAISCILFAAAGIASRSDPADAREPGEAWVRGSLRLRNL